MSIGLSLLPPAPARTSRLEATLLGLIERHGRWRIIRASLFARRSKRVRLDDMSDALRRDIGLPAEPSSRPVQRQHLL